MAEKKEKIPLTGIIRVPESIDHEIDTEASRLGLFKYEVAIRAWETYKKQVGIAQTAGNEQLPWPRDVRDGEDLVEEFIALLKHPAPGDQMGGGGMRRHIIDHLRDARLRAERASAKPPVKR